MMLQTSTPPVPPMPPIDPMRALGRRLEAKGTDAALRSEVERLQHRLEEVDGLQVRVAELEERLDFAERMLVRGQESTPETGRLERP